MDLVRPPLADHKIGVLVVEDDAFLRLDLTTVLNKAGFATFEATSADEAMSLLASRDDIRMLITDVAMPDSAMDGFQLAKLVAARWPHIGLMLVSGTERPKRGDLPIGVRFAPKPYRHQDLIGAVFAHVERQTDEL